MHRDDDAGLYVMSVAAQLTGVHPQTLRLYERKGLVEPARTGGGSRRYSDRDLDRLRHIAQLTGSGVNLAGVRRILDLEDQLAATRAELERARRERSAAVEQAHRAARARAPYRADTGPRRRARGVGANPFDEHPDGGTYRRHVS